MELQIAIDGRIVVGDPDCDSDPCEKHGRCHCMCPCDPDGDDNCAECTFDEGGTT